MYVKCGAYYKLIWNQSNDQLPVGLLAQLVEGCTGITPTPLLTPCSVLVLYLLELATQLKLVLCTIWKSPAAC